MAKKDIIIIVSTFIIVSMICAGLIVGSLYLKKKTAEIEQPKYEEEVLEREEGSLYKIVKITPSPINSDVILDLESL